MIELQQSVSPGKVSMIPLVLGRMPSYMVDQSPTILSTQTPPIQTSKFLAVAMGGENGKNQLTSVAVMKKFHGRRDAMPNKNIVNAAKPNLKMYCAQ